MNENHDVNRDENSQEVLHVVSNLVNEIVNSTAVVSNASPISSVAAPSQSVNPKPKDIQTPPKNHETSPGTTSQCPNACCNQNDYKPTYEIYRATGQFTESQSDLDVGFRLSRLAESLKNRSTPAVPSFSGPCVPPSYSTVIKQGRPSLDIRREARSMEGQHLSPFTRVPPPSYAQIHGVWSREMSNTSSHEVLLGPDPVYIWCTHCATVVISVTESQRTKFTHFTAAALCFFGCWPCAMLPYCMNSCKNIYHFCPDCHYLFGMYRPW